MPVLETLVGPIASIIDKIIPDKEARAKAKLALIEMEGTHELRQIEARLSAIRPQSDRAGLCFKARRDPRITPLGRLLRRSKSVSPTRSRSRSP